MREKLKRVVGGRPQSGCWEEVLYKKYFFPKRTQLENTYVYWHEYVV
jgi:hypothetical protein